MLPKQVRIGLLDDHVIFRKTLKAYLSERTNFQVSLQAADFFELLGNLRETPIDVLLLDIFLPRMNGNDAVKLIRRDHPDIKIIVLSMTMDMDVIGSILDEGVQGFVSKADEPEELVAAIEAAAGNKIYRNRIFTEALYWNSQYRHRPLTQVRVQELNDREKKIIQLIWEEKSNKEIADVLYLGVRSVEKIRQEIKEKTGAASTVGVLKYAIEKRIITVALNRTGIAQ